MNLFQMMAAIGKIKKTKREKPDPLPDNYPYLMLDTDNYLAIATDEYFAI